MSYPKIPEHLLDELTMWAHEHDLEAASITIAVSGRENPEGRIEGRAPRIAYDVVVVPTPSDIDNRPMIQRTLRLVDLVEDKLLGQR